MYLVMFIGGSLEVWQDVDKAEGGGKNRLPILKFQNYLDLKSDYKMSIQRKIYVSAKWYSIIFDSSYPPYSYLSSFNGNEERHYFSFRLWKLT